MSEVLTARRTLMVRQAKVSDVAALIRLLELHWADLPWGHVPMDEERIIRLFIWGITSERCACWVAEEDAVVGFIGMMLEEQPLTGQIVAREAWWFVDPAARGTAGLRLLKAAEAWAAQRQVPMIVSIHDAMVGRLLTGLGYRRTGLTYQKGQ